MEWVLNYYIKGVPNWNWYYDNHYAPLSTNLRDSIESYVHTTFKKSSPVHPLQQLISVLPPKSAGLLPPPFDQVFRDPYISKYSPEEFEIDLTGTKKEWEGIVIIPFLNPDLVKMVLSKTLRQLDEKDMKRMITGKNIKYIINGYETEFKSFYGNIKTYASFEFIDF
jgi:5'-3' exonuclease